MPRVTPKKASLLLQEDEQLRLDKALAKAKAKKPLSAADRKIIARYQGEDSGRPTYYDSIANAAALLRIPPKTLRRAKKEGAPGFRGSRVYPEELLPWLKDRASQSTTGAGDEKERLEIDRLRIAIEREQFELAKAKGQYTPNTVLVPAVRKLAKDVQRILRGKLEKEYPSVVTGLEPAAARVYGKRVVDEICRQFEKLVHTWDF